jgi:hypothetical protein
MRRVRMEVPRKEAALHVKHPSKADQLIRTLMIVGAGIQGIALPPPRIPPPHTHTTSINLSQAKTIY